MRFELGQKIIDIIRKPFIRVRTRVEYKEVFREIDLNFKLKEMFEVCGDLADDYSKETYLNVLQYRLNPNFGIKSALPVPSSELCEQISVKNSDEFEVFNGVCHFKINEINLSPLGVDLRFYGDARGIYFVTEQYAYKNADIDVKDGDVVIDGGGCYGDTALWFAHKVGEKGRVYSFEFVEGNLKVFKAALDLNPDIMGRIKVLNNALYSNSDTKLYVYENGSGTQALANGGGGGRTPLP